VGTHVRNVIVNVVAGAYVLPHTARLKLMRMCGVTVGSGTIIKSRCTFTGDVSISIGANCYVGHRCLLDASAPITVEDGVYMAHRVNILTTTHNIGGPKQRAATPPVHKPVTIGEGCWLATDVTVLPGVTIATGCVIAAGAVVTADCGADGLYAGVPAKRIREL